MSYLYDGYRYTGTLAHLYVSSNDYNWIPGLLWNFAKHFVSLEIMSHKLCMRADKYNVILRNCWIELYSCFSSRQDFWITPVKKTFFAYIENIYVNHLQSIALSLFYAFVWYMLFDAPIYWSSKLIAFIDLRTLLTLICAISRLFQIILRCISIYENHGAIEFACRFVKYFTSHKLISTNCYSRIHLKNNILSRRGVKYGILNWTPYSWLFYSLRILINIWEC